MYFRTAKQNKKSGYYWLTYFHWFGFYGGLAILLLMPPFEAPDEHSHFFRAYAIAIGNPLAQISGVNLGAPVPRHAIDLHGAIWGPITRYPEHKFAVDSMLRAYQEIPFQDHTEYMAFNNNAIYNPFPYLASAAGLWLGQLFQLNPLMIFYLGRLSNFLVALALTRQALKLLPQFGLPLTIFCLFPMPMMLRSSFSPDAITNALSLYLIAWILHAAGRAEVLSRLKKFIFLLLLTTTSLCKQAYLFLTLTAWILPKEKFLGLRLKISTCLIAAALILSCNSIWTYLVKDQFAFYSWLGNVNPAGQTQWIIEHPLQFAQVLIRENISNAKRYLFEMIGSNLGWNDTPLPFEIILGLILVLLSGIWRNRKQKHFLRSWQIGVLLITLLASMGLLSSALYISGTPIGHDKVIGIQGRYYLPLFPLLVIILCTGFIKFKKNQTWGIGTQHTAGKWILGLNAMLLLWAGLIWLERYYLVPTLQSNSTLLWQVQSPWQKSNGFDVNAFKVAERWVMLNPNESALLKWADEPVQAIVLPLPGASLVELQTLMRNRFQFHSIKVYNPPVTETKVKTTYFSQTELTALQQSCYQWQVLCQTYEQWDLFKLDLQVDLQSRTTSATLELGHQRTIYWIYFPEESHPFLWISDLSEGMPEALKPRVQKHEKLTLMVDLNTWRQNLKQPQLKTMPITQDLKAFKPYRLLLLNGYQSPQPPFYSWVDTYEKLNQPVIQTTPKSTLLMQFSKDKFSILADTKHR